MIVGRPVLTIVRSLAAASLLGSVGLIGYSGFAATTPTTVVEAAVAGPSHCCNNGGGRDEGKSAGDEGGNTVMKGTTTTTTTAMSMSMKGMATPTTTSGSDGDLPFEGGLLLGGAGLGLLGAARRLRIDGR